MDSSTKSPPAKSTFSCIRCAERKVKCDKETPCGACVKHNAECVFRPPKPSRRRRKLAREEFMLDRLKQYENLLQQKGIDPGQVNVAIPETGNTGIKDSHSEASETVWQLSTPSPNVSGPQKTLFEPHLIHGQKGTKLVDNNLWSRVAEEIQEAEDDSEEDTSNDEVSYQDSNNDFAYVMDWKMPNSLPSHPPADQIRYLWQSFVENVDPIVKVVHVPTLQSAMEKAISDVHRVPKGFEALMFAIYSVAVLSLTEAECNASLGEPRESLLPAYVAATKAALTRAKFMSTQSIVVAQALVLHIISIRDAYDPRAVWSLTGLAIRVVENMGLHFDGTLLGLSPFESEIRRRIWWQLRMHDFRASELAGQAKFRQFDLSETSPKPIANVNDIDIYPSMTKAPVESSKATEMIWGVFRCDLATFASTQKVKMQRSGKEMFSSEEYPAMDDLKIKDEFGKKLEDLMETKYLRFCDPSKPIQFLTLLGARLSADLLKFMAHHPRRWAKMKVVPTSEQQLVWDIAIQLLERYNMLQSNPQLRRFAWNAVYFIQWQAVIHVLDALRADPLRSDTEKAWGVIDGIFQLNSTMLLDTKRPIFMAVGNLCLKAFNARKAAIGKRGSTPRDLPDYIIKLQHQREAAKLRRQAAREKKRGANNAGGDVGSIALAPDGTRPAAHPDSNIQDPTSNIYGSKHTGDDSFWLSEGQVNYLQVDEGCDPMNTDMDALWAEDSPQDFSDGVIDWTQWDTWLGSMDPVYTGVTEEVI